MKVRRYEACDMNEAVKMVKAELGQNAVILSSRRKTRGEGAFGMFGRSVVEVTAALPHEQPQKRRGTNGGLSGGDNLYRSAGVRKRGVAGSHDEAINIGKSAAIAVEPLIDGIEEIKETLNSFMANESSPADSAIRVTDDVRELKSMISYLIDQSAIEKESGLGRNFLALKRILSERGVSAEFSQTIIDEFREIGANREPDMRTLIEATAVRMRDVMTFGGVIDKPETNAEGPKVVALVGPTGSGKTTTIAKIAANLTVDGARVGLITVDTYRIAAVEQLKIYANILNIPLEVALTPQDIGRAVRLFKNMDVVLIDTAGRSQRDTAKIMELKKFLAKGTDVDTRLVISAASSEQHMEETVKGFSGLSVSGLVFTKLDEAAMLGPIFNVSVRTGLPVSYFTTGQSVPEDMEEATSGFYIKRLFKTNKAVTQN